MNMLYIFLAVTGSLFWLGVILIGLWKLYADLFMDEDELIVEDFNEWEWFGGKR